MQDPIVFDIRRENIGWFALGMIAGMIVEFLVLVI